MTNDLLIVLSGPSGVGKNAIRTRYCELYDDMAFSISFTTRAIREGEEVDGRDYNFISMEEFERRLANDEFLEKNKAQGNQYYGTHKGHVEALFALGKNVLLDIDSSGMRQVVQNAKKRKPVTVFVYPENMNMDIARKRLLERGTETPEQIEERVRIGHIELSRIREYEYAIENREGDLDTAVSQLRAIVTAEKLKTRRLDI